MQSDIPARLAYTDVGTARAAAMSGLSVTLPGKWHAFDAGGGCSLRS